MKNEILNTILNQLTFERKPESFESIKTSLSSEIEFLVNEMIEQLPSFIDEQLKIKNPIDFFDNDCFFRGEAPQYFVLVVEGKRYLVNTERFNYCRYLLKID